MRDAQSDRLDLEIKQLERDKKIEEIKQIRDSARIRWVTPVVLVALVPLVAGLGAWITNEIKQYGEGYRAIADLEKTREERNRLQQQKDSLNLEVGTLIALKAHYAEQSKSSQDRFEARQKQIDVAYLRARFLISDASYALGHIKGMGPGPDRAALDRLKQEIQALPDQTRSQLDDLISRYDSTMVIIDATQNFLAPASEALKLIPVSEWATKLHPMPTGSVIRDRKIMVWRSDPGKLYDVDEDRFLTKDEIEQLKRRR